MKKSRLILPLALFGATIVASIPLCVHVFDQVIAEDGLKNVNIYSTYSLNDKIVIPNNASILSEGIDYPVRSVILTMPNGVSISGREFSLISYGNYSIYFESNSSDSSGSKITYSKEFSVNQFYFNASSNNTSISYGSINKSFSVNNYYSGLKLKMGAGDTFSYSKPFNIYDNPINEVIGFNVLQYQPNKVREIVVRLTDAYDPSIYVDIIQTKKDYDYENYISVSAYGNKSVAVKENSKGIIKDKDKYYSVENDFPGIMARGNQSINSTYNNLYYTLDTTSKTNIKFYETTDAVVETLFVSELNNPNIYSYGFNGFTTGDVYLSLNVDAFFNTDYADVEIAHIFGVSGSALKPMDYYYDTKAPIFLSEVNENERNIVAGVACNVPGVKALDDTGLRGSTTTTVYYNYDGNNRIIIPQNNGKFTPTYLGTYTIIYSATDYYGNVGTYRLDLYAIKRDNKGISIDVNVPSSSYAGEAVNLETYEVNSLAPSSVKVDIKVTKPDSTSESIQDNASKYSLKMLGDYKITYTYSDFYYSSTYTFTLHSLNKGYGTFAKTSINIQPYYICGATYSLEEVKAYVYTETSEEETDVLAEVSYNGGTYQEINRSQFTIEDTTGTIQFRYSLKDRTSEYIESEVAKVIKVENYGTTDKKVALGIGDYFVSPTDSFESTGTYEYLTYITKTSGNMSLDFVNKLLFSQFSTTLIINQDVNYDFDIVLTDFSNRDNKFVISFITVNGIKNYVSVNNGGLIQLSNSWNDGGNLQIIIDDDNKQIKIGSDSLSYSFEMPNEYCLMSMNFKNANDGDEIHISKLLGQSLNTNVKRDTGRPIVVADLPEIPAKIGDEITLYKPYVCDVLSPTSEETASLQVRFAEASGSYNVVSDTNGCRLNKTTDFSSPHVVNIPTYGSLLIEYFFTDGVGNDADLSSGLNLLRVICTDDIAPTISIKGYKGTPVKVKVNTEITPLDVEVSDNFTSIENLSIYYFVYETNGCFVTSCEYGKTFKLTKSGNYIVYAYCEDEAGNTSYASYLMNA